jgi:hypothetical protein
MVRGDDLAAVTLIEIAAHPCETLFESLAIMADPPAWDPVRYARRHHVENLFSRLKDFALRRDKTRRSWMGFAHLAATMINLRIADAGHRPFCNGPSVVTPP